MWFLCSYKNRMLLRIGQYLRKMFRLLWIIIVSWRCCLLGGFKYHNWTIFPYFNVYVTNAHVRSTKPGTGTLSSSSGELKWLMGANTHAYSERHAVNCTVEHPAPILDLLPAGKRTKPKLLGLLESKWDQEASVLAAGIKGNIAPCNLD